MGWQKMGGAAALRGNPLEEGVKGAVSGGAHSRRAIIRSRALSVSLSAGQKRGAF